MYQNSRNNTTVLAGSISSGEKLQMQVDRIKQDLDQFHIKVKSYQSCQHGGLTLSQKIQYQII